MNFETLYGFSQKAVQGFVESCPAFCEKPYRVLGKGRTVVYSYIASDVNLEKEKE